MPSLSENVENRVRKLPKPSNAAQALQPVFEAVSNAFYAIEDRFNEQALQEGRVRLSVENLADPGATTITVTDNGIGLDCIRYDAFCVIDTDYKRERGGKGVGRLFWLDAFDEVSIFSRYLEDDRLSERAFRFRLTNEEQIELINPDSSLLAPGEVGTVVNFTGIRQKDYLANFPRSANEFRNHFSSHFVGSFLVGGTPLTHLDVNGEIDEFPKAVRDLVGAAPVMREIEFEAYGPLIISAFLCEPAASGAFGFKHALHLLANGRTVETRKIDGLVGKASFYGDEKDGLYLHICVQGEYLDVRVNEGRTAFTFDERAAKALTRSIVEQVKVGFFADQFGEYSAERKKNYESFVRRHPIYGFDDPDTQLSKIAFGANKPEDFATGLVKYQIRRDEERQDAVQAILEEINSENLPNDFSAAVVAAAEGIKSSEQLALAQHVTRRKLVLDLLDNLLKRTRERPSGEDETYLEASLHALICPMGVVGIDPLEQKSRAHDLWVVDERLTFTRAFSSDKRLKALLTESDKRDRPDLIVWDFASGLGTVSPQSDDEGVDTSEALDKVMVVEFKKPGRRTYSKPEDQIEQQIIKYLSELKGGQIEGFGRDPVRITDDCVFYCYVVADIVGDLDQQLSSWQTTSSGRGRFRALENKYKGFIEVVQWRDLVNDAWRRNEATLNAAGLRRSANNP